MPPDAIYIEKMTFSSLVSGVVHFGDVRRRIAAAWLGPASQQCRVHFCGLVCVSAATHAPWQRKG